MGRSIEKGDDPGGGSLVVVHVGEDETTPTTGLRFG